MAAGNQILNQLPEKSRLRNPLNVVVEKVGATRAMVHGDVSVESLKELLMSSLSLIDEKKSKKSGASDWKREANDQEETDSSSTSKYIDKEKSTTVSGSSASLSDDKKGQRMGGIKLTKIDDGIEAPEKRFPDAKKTGDKTKSKKFIGERRRTFSKKNDRKLKSEGVNEEEEEEEGEEEHARESLQSCITLFGTEESPLSNDGLWLRRNFGKSLVQGLRDVVNKKPDDPVGYLAFCLRKYRSQEEVRQRKRDFDKELKRKRLSMANRVTEEDDLAENVNPEYYGDDEEGGGNGDWNFKNY